MSTTVPLSAPQIKRPLSTSADPYSRDYFAARDRFLTAATAAGCRIESHPIEARGPDGEELTIDVAILGSERPEKSIVISGGLHGVEAFLGSAVQVSFLENVAHRWSPPRNGSVVMLHGLNPYGFAWRRRFNENNVDLNRNFLLEHEPYDGASPLNEVLYSAFMSKSPPRRWDLFIPKLAMIVLRHGRPALWDALPVGQYKYPDWIFYGGDRPAETQRIVADNVERWLGSPREVVHLDFHTGLGKWGTSQLLLSERSVAHQVGWWRKLYGQAKVVFNAELAYRHRGGFGSWLQSRFPGCDYRFATAEYGTYQPLQVLGALIKETRAHHRGPVLEPCDAWTRDRLAEVFVPRSRRWRQTALTDGMNMVQQAIAASWQE